MMNDEAGISCIINRNWSVSTAKSLYQVWMFQIAWGQISFILGVVGNVFTLYATTAHNAIKLDKMSIWIIKNLAVVDICNCFLVVFPILLNQYGKFNGLIIFGRTFNEIMGHYRYLFLVANLFLVNILSLNKLFRCLFPLRYLFPTRCQKNIVTIATVVVSMIPTLYTVYAVKTGFEKITSEWQVRNYLGAAYIGGVKTLQNECFTSEFDLVLAYVIAFVFSALPCLSLVIFNSSLVINALLKANLTVNKMNILAVILVTTGFLISFLPYFFFMVFDRISDEADELSWSITYLSVWINPIIYLAVNPSFRRFTIERLSKVKSVGPLKRTLPQNSMNNQGSAANNINQPGVLETPS